MSPDTTATKDLQRALTCPEVRDAQVGLLAVAQVGLRDQDVAHGQHAQAADLLGRVEDDGREAGGHLRVEPDLDALQGGKERRNASAAGSELRKHGR